jgi:DUF1365 family protein
VTRIEPGHAIYEGTVWHHRRHPEHRFTQSTAMAWIDLDRLEELEHQSRWLSQRPWSPVRYRRADYFGDPNLDLADSVRDRVAETLGVRPDGSVHLLANLRTWGWCFNPIAIYWCADAYGEPTAQMLEVTNTPWHERHVYVIDRRGPVESAVSFDKALHVSPFLPMDLRYTLRDALPGETVDMELQVSRADEVVFSAGVRAHRQSVSSPVLRRLALRTPTQRVSLGIHVQAARLWRKRAVVHRHPARNQRKDPVEQ